MMKNEWTFVWIFQNELKNVSDRQIEVQKKDDVVKTTTWSTKHAKQRENDSFNKFCCSFVMCVRE